jgi:hypothetical protein
MSVCMFSWLSCLYVRFQVLGVVVSFICCLELQQVFMMYNVKLQVMDKGSLASRKKFLHAQTEREILQSLGSSIPSNTVYTF